MKIVPISSSLIINVLRGFPTTQHRFRISRIVPTLAYRREDGALERIVPISTFDSQWIRAKIPPKWGENRSNFVIVDYQCITWLPTTQCRFRISRIVPTLAYRREDGVPERIVPISTFDTQWIRTKIPPKWGENRSNFVIVDYQWIREWTRSGLPGVSISVVRA